MSPSLSSLMSRGGPSTSTFRLVRAGALSDDVTAAATRVDEFAALARPQSPVLVVERDEGTIRQFLVISGRGDHHRAAESLGYAVAAKAVPIPEDEQLTLSGRAVQRLMVPVFRYQTGRSTLAGQNPFEVAHRAASALRDDGQWLAITFRSPSGRERAKWDQFLDSRDVQTHHSREHGSVMAAFFAGGGSRSANRDVLVSLASAMPGFDEIANPSGVGFGASLTRALLAVIVGVLAAVGVTLGVQELAPIVESATGTIGYPVDITPFARVLAAIPVVIGVLFALRPLGRALRMKTASIPVFHPPRRLRSKAPVTKRLEDGTTRREPGERPLRRDVFKVSPVSFVGAVAPHVDSEAGTGVTRERSAPSEVTQGRVGFVLGPDRRGAPAQLPAISSYEGTAIFGAPGKGKTTLQEAEFAYQLLERTDASTMPHSPGTQNTIVFFDTKGDTWRGLQEWCEQFGVDPVVIHAADDPWETVGPDGNQIPEARRRQNSDVIDVLWSRGNADRRARFVADMLKQTMDEGSIQGQSLETLTKVFTGAFAVTGEMVEAARAAAHADSIPFIPEGQPVTTVSVAWAFLGDPDARAGELLYAQLAAQAQEDRARGASTDAVLGTQALSSLYGPGVTAAQRRPLLQAPRNKVSLMQTAPFFWDTANHDAEVGALRPGSAAWLADQQTAREQEASDSGVAAADPIGGFTSVANPFANIPTVEDSSTLIGDDDAVTSPVITAHHDGESVDTPRSSDYAEVQPRIVHSWDELLAGHQVVIINTGLAPESDTFMPEEGKELVTSTIFFSMVRAIQRVASGWRDEGRRITIMADELSMIAAENEEMIEWLREKGRAYGVELSLATQRTGQLSPRMLESLFGFGTLIAFSQDNGTVAETLAENLAADGTPWSKQDIVNLPAFNVIVRTRTDRRLPAFTVSLANFEEDHAKFADYQKGSLPLPGKKAGGAS